MVVHTENGERLYRISPWAKYVTQQENARVYDWVHWDPPEPYTVRPPGTISFEFLLLLVCFMFLFHNKNYKNIYIFNDIQSSTIPLRIV